MLVIQIYVGKITADPAPAPSKLNFVRDAKTGKIVKAEVV